MSPNSGLSRYTFHCCPYRLACEPSDHNLVKHPLSLAVNTEACEVRAFILPSQTNSYPCVLNLPSSALQALDCPSLTVMITRLTLQTSLYKPKRSCRRKTLCHLIWPRFWHIMRRPSKQELAPKGRLVKPGQQWEPRPPRRNYGPFSSHLVSATSVSNNSGPTSPNASTSEHTRMKSAIQKLQVNLKTSSTVYTTISHSYELKLQPVATPS